MAPHRTRAACSIALLGKIPGSVRREEVPNTEHGGTMYLGFISAPASEPDIADSASPSDAVLTLNALCDRLADARPGTSITYHVGMLARDREPKISELPEEQRRELQLIADRARDLAACGWAHLLQRRVGPRCFAYLLIVRPRPRQARLPSVVGVMPRVAEVA
jgi:hypothetical protein